MKKALLLVLLLSFASSTLSADNNKTTTSAESNATKRANEQLKIQQAREKKFAREQTFYKGKNHDLSYAEINPDSIDSVPLIEPDYDFDMDDVYD
jgi:hypothetical protein